MHIQIYSQPPWYLHCCSQFCLMMKANCVFLPLCVRPSASHILRAGLLVLYFLLRAEPASRRDLPRLPALADSGRLHGPLQLRAVLPGPVVQRQPQRSSGANAQTYWYCGFYIRSAHMIGLIPITNNTSLCICHFSWLHFNFFKAAGCGCITSEEKCLLSVSVTAPSLSRAPTVTSATAGTLPPSAKSPQVSVKLKQTFFSPCAHK